jgi:hypothetical protein
LVLQVDDLAGGIGGLEQAADVGVVAGDDMGVQVGGCLGDDGVDNVTGCGAAHERTGGVSFLFGQREDLAAAQSRRSWTWAGERLAWAITGAGTTGMIPASSRTQ